MTAGHDGQLGVGQQLHDPLAERAELGVALADQHGYGHRELLQPAPQRLHLAGADAAQHRGKRVGPVAALILARERVDLGWVLGEQRLRAPALDELLERDALELVARVRSSASRRAARSRGSSMPALAGDEHQAGHALGRGQRHVQRHAPAHRVPAQREALRAAREHVCDTAGERDRAFDVGRIAVAGQVERQRPVAFPVERRDHAVPRAVRAAESVQQDDALAASEDPMTPTTDMYTLLRAFVDELARCGMRAACTSPGSRSAPLVLSLAREQRVRCFSHVDERCAGFFALGLAKASGLPVAVACTSGTAAAELLPAAVEAREARVPLLLLTADRPAELRENGAGQAIDQLKLFGGAAKWFFEVGVHEAGVEQLRWMRTLACRAYWTALEGSPGAVHLNFPLREPLVSEDPLPEDPTGRRDGAPYVRRRADPGSEAPDATLRELVAGARRGVLVAGRDERETGLGEAAAAFAAAAGWPLLADPLSGARRGEAAIAHYDALLRDEAFAAVAGAGLVVRVGDLPVSKPLRSVARGARRRAPGGARPRGRVAGPRVGARRLARARAGGRALARWPRGSRARPGRALAPTRTGRRAGAAPTSAPPRRSSGCSAASCPSRRWRPSWACCCRRTRRCSSPPRCPCATSRRSGPSAPTRRACCATAAPTASTAPSPRPSAPPRSGPARWCC